MALAGFLTIVVMLALIMTKRVSAMVALIVVPVAAALLVGTAPEGVNPFINLSKHMVNGIKDVAPTVAMFIFAILYFSIMSDAGMFDPVINAIIKAVHGDPTRIVVGTAVLAMVAHLDGSGASTFLITVPAVIPLYERMKLDYRVLACVVALSAGTMNMLPWGGPTIRAATALKVDVTALFNPMVPAQIAGLLTVLAIAWMLGRREARRIGFAGGGSVNAGAADSSLPQLSDAEKALRRPRLVWLNMLFTVVIIVCLVFTKIAPAVLFMFGTILCLLCNYPNVADQRQRVDAHAKAALLMATVLLAAGCFTGIMKGMGFLDAMSKSAVAFIPSSMAGYIPLLIALVAMPLSLLFDPDSYYFGILPVLAGVLADFGMNPMLAGQASILGQMTVGFPLSPLTPATFLLIGLAKVELGEHQRFTFPLAYLVSIVMTVVAVISGVLPI